MADLLIRNGMLVDGTGAPRRQADVAIDHGTIVAVGDEASQMTASRTIDAEGLIVTPGWVDIHTHYDGQVTWDAEVSPSSLNGVTSLVMGNCGVGFAPARPDSHEWLISLLEGVEDIPGSALSEGISWGWETFNEYLDVLDRMHWTLDVGAQLPHAALRTYVMGSRGADHLEQATDLEIEEMSLLTEAAVRAGALGFTTSRTWTHRTSTGANIGTLGAANREVLGIAGALRRANAGVVQLISDVYQSDDEALVQTELELIGQLALQIGRPLSLTLLQEDGAPQRFREILAAIAGWNQAGAHVRAQVAVRPIGMILGLSGTMYPFGPCPTYQRFQDLELAQRVEVLRRPEIREAVLAEHAALHPQGIFALVQEGFDRMYPFKDPPDYEPVPADSVGGLARRSGRDPRGVLYDVLLEDSGNRLLYIPLMNYARGDLEDLREMLVSPYALFGLSDAGAHCRTVSDGSFPTTAITLWTRDRTRGPGLDLEFIVHHQTQRTAAHVGWLDRGVVAPGYVGDLNVIDLEALTLHPPTFVHDLPGGGSRLMQCPTGYIATIKDGSLIAENGELTGERPGRLLRGRQPAPAA